MSRHLPAAASLILLAAGVALVFEIVRPFRDLSIDGPIAMGCWAAGILLPAMALWHRRGVFAVNVAALSLNAVALAAMGGLLLLLATSPRLF